MQKLMQQILTAKNSSVKETINQRLADFSSFAEKNLDEWFSELCFCILTANSKAETAISIQKQLGKNGFLVKSQEELSSIIRQNKHRFHNNKAKYIVMARPHRLIKSTILLLAKKQGETEAREWLVSNIKGIGYKEASHFLRNVGYKNIAILDRHILSLMLEQGLLAEKPKSLNRKTYLKIEKEFAKIAKRAGMSLAELDLYMWFLKTGKVLK